MCSINLHNISCILAFLAIFGVLLPVSAQFPPQCYPFPQYNAKAPFRGYLNSVCSSLFVDEGYSGFYTSLDRHTSQIPGCHPYGIFTADAPVKSLASIFIAADPAILLESKPSDRCQNVLTTAMCYGLVQTCDYGQGLSQGQGNSSAPPQKACKWLCSTLYKDGDPANGINDEVCTADDVAYLLTYDIDIRKLPGLDCTSADHWEQDETNTSSCVAPTNLPVTSSAPKCQLYTGSFCTSVFPSGTYVYIPSGNSQAEMETALGINEYVLNALPPGHCPAAFVRIACQTVFRECLHAGTKRYVAKVDANNSIVSSTPQPAVPPVVFPLAPPMSACAEYIEACGSSPYFNWPESTISVDCRANLFNDSPEGINCWTTSSIAMKSYSLRTQTFFQPFTYSIFNMTGPATNLGTDEADIYSYNTFAFNDYFVHENAIAYPSSCPEPLVKVPNIDDSNIFRGSCALPCPNMVYNNDERRQIDIFSIVLATIALVCSGLLFLTYSIFDSQRKKRIILYYTTCVFATALIIFINMLVRDSKYFSFGPQCKNDHEYYHMERWTLFSGMVLIYALIASSTWWCMQSVDLFERLILGRVYKVGSVAEKRRTVAMHLFCWGFPFICLLGIIVTGQIGNDGNLPFAFITLPHNLSSNPIEAHFPFFYAPIFVLAIIGIILVGVVFYYLIRYDATKNTAGLRKFQERLAQSKARWFKFQQGLKLFGFVGIMLVFACLMLAYQITLLRNRVNWDRALVRYAEDIIHNNSQLGQSASSRASVGTISLTIFGLLSQSICILLVYFVFSVEIYRLWAGLFVSWGCTCCESFARSDRSSDPLGDSSQGTSHKSTDTSTDLLTSDGTGGGLRKGTVSNPSALNESFTDSTNHHKPDVPPSRLSANQKDPNLPRTDSDNLTLLSAGSGASSSQGPSPIQSQSRLPPSKHSKHNREVQTKRTALFKGFKNATVLTAPSTTGVPNNPSYDSSVNRASRTSRTSGDYNSNSDVHGGGVYSLREGDNEHEPSEDDTVPPMFTTAFNQITPPLPRTSISLPSPNSDTPPQQRDHLQPSPGNHSANESPLIQNAYLNTPSNIESNVSAMFGNFSTDISTNQPSSANIILPIDSGDKSGNHSIQDGSD